MSAILCIQKWLIFKLAGITESDPSCHLKEGLFTGKVWMGVPGVGNCPYFDHLSAPFCPTCRYIKQEIRCRRQLCSARKQFRRPQCPFPSLIFKLQWYKYRQIKKHKTGNKQKNWVRWQRYGFPLTYSLQPGFFYNTVEIQSLLCYLLLPNFLLLRAKSLSHSPQWSNISPLMLSRGLYKRRPTDESCWMRTAALLHPLQQAD